MNGKWATVAAWLAVPSRKARPTMPPPTGMAQEPLVHSSGHAVAGAAVGAPHHGVAAALVQPDGHLVVSSHLEERQAGSPAGLGRIEMQDAR
jgi:hypothetical protein